MTTDQTVHIDTVKAYFAERGCTAHVVYRDEPIIVSGEIGEVTIYAPNSLGEVRASGSAAIFPGDVITAYNFERIKGYAK